MRTVLSIILSSLWLCCIPLQAFAAEKLTATKLLDRYAESQDKLSSFIAETECSISLKSENEDKPVYIRKITKVYVNGERYHTKTTRRWSKLAPKDATKPVEEEKLYYDLWDDNLHMMYKYGPHVDIDTNEESAKSLLDVSILGIPFLVRTSAFERLDIVLRQAKTISVRDKLELIGSEDCYVIDAKTTSGTYTVWLDPQHDYHIARAEIRVGPGEKYRMRTLDDSDRCFFLIRNIRFEKIDGIWIPMAADTHYEKFRPNPEFCWSEDADHKITKITLNPDHEAIGSFVPDIEYGTTVIDRDCGVEYTWQEGMKFVVDQWDGSIKYVPEDWSLQVGVDKPLPDFEGIEINLPSEQIKDKAILVCFFDMQQRPSRNCLRQLSTRAQELKEKDIVIITIQASKVEQSKLDEWIKEQDISFPVGIIKDDEEKIRFTWGVRSLPWLVLTDKKHIVTAEGFALTELDEKLMAK